MLCPAVVVLTSLAAFSQGYTECLKVASVPVDEEWYLEKGAHSFNVIEHSRCNNCQNNENWTWFRGRTVGQEKKKVCRAVSVWTRDGDFTLPLNCEYSKVEEQQCKADFSKVKRLSDVNIGGSFTLTMTDNATFIAGVACIFGKENLWWLLSPTKSVAPEIKLKVEAHFQEAGFTAPIATRENAPVVFKHIHITEGTCD